jgi:predicted MPP superfamily phosphohydrolase
VKRISRRRFLKTIGFTGAGMVGFTSYGLAVEPVRRLNVTRYQVSPPNWPAGFGLRIGVVADLHAGEWIMPAERVLAIAERTNALQPDVIVLLGDFVASRHLRTHEIAPEEWSEPLGILKAPLGVHAILGNHDWWDDDDAQEAGRGPVLNRRALERIGLPVYENDSVRLVKGGRPFWLAGLADQLALQLPRIRGDRRRRYRGIDDLAGTLAQVTDDAPVILLAHEPDIFPHVPPRVSLTLSGHTHGGQVRMFGYSPWVPSRYGNRYAYGHVIEDDRHLIVSGGLGCSIVPLRIGVPPEIVLVDVVA